ncbi:hypothetical protein JX266_005088 [Neoarthrinium moseri]|nr:hypothetical protein JX266_005088 [Neoarthrinium moseri]
MSDSAKAESEKRAMDFITEVWALAGVALFVSGLRFYQRISTVGWKRLALDDYLMAFVTAFTTFEFYLGYTVVAYWQGLANNAMTPEQRATLDPASNEYYLRVSGSKTHVGGLLTYTTQLWLLKACWALYYNRLTDGVQDRRLLIRWSVVVLPITYAACLLVAFFKCIPFNHQWQINPEPPINCMPAISPLQTIFVMAMNTVTDFYLMAIPLPMIWRSGLPLKKKIAVLTLFSGAFVEMAFGILRCVSILTVGNTDPSQSGYWSIRESFVSEVLTNMPMVYALVRSFSHKIQGKPDYSKGQNSGSYQLGTYPRNRSGTGQNIRSAPNGTAFDSKEQIYIDEGQQPQTDDDERSLELPYPRGDRDFPRLHARDIEAVNKEAGVSRYSRYVPRQENHIYVTTEYTVSNDERGSKRSIGPAL